MIGPGVASMRFCIFTTMELFPYAVGMVVMLKEKVVVKGRSSMCDGFERTFDRGSVIARSQLIGNEDVPLRTTVNRTVVEVVLSLY